MPDEKLIWITGASRGIGLSLAKELAKTGARLVLSARSPGGQYEFLGHFPQGFIDYKKVHYYPCNVSNKESVPFVYENIKRDLGPVDVLINNAGVAKFGSFLDTGIEDFENMMNTNLRGAYLAIQAVLPAMLEKESGMIVNINSISAFTDFATSAVYNASKAGLRAMSRCLRMETRRKGIQVIDVFPGATETGIWSEKMREKYAEVMMSPDEIARAVAATIHSCLDGNLTVEEITLRPKRGDLD